VSIDSASQRALLALARSAIAASLGVDRDAVVSSHPVFEQRRGAFVTLTLERRLRGCIGRVDPGPILRELIPDVARSAAFSDPRFAPLAIDELSRVRIEISLLSVPEAAAGAQGVVVGRHGVIVEARGRRGLLLPQVAAEHAWGREELLEHACVKASLPPDAWRRGDVRILTFEALVFAESGVDG
jgi:AmmeMemoRadiSam system protein A